MGTGQKGSNLPNQFVNHYKPGRIAWKCSKCGKQIWLEPHIYEQCYKEKETCLDCQ